jgi:hypothetical protein
MTVHTICDRCGMEYDHAGVSIGDRVYCCAGCASGGPCTCAVTNQDTVIVDGSGTTVVSGADTVVVE